MWTWNFLFSPYGRVSRKTYWLRWLLPYLGISIVVAILDTVLFPADPRTGEPPPIFQGIATLVFFWPSIAMTTKRLHDRNMTGWWQAAPILITIPIIALASYWYYTTRMTEGAQPELGILGGLLFIVLASAAFWLFLYPLINVLFLRGTTGPNQYGDDPLGENTAEVFA